MRTKTKFKPELDDEKRLSGFAFFVDLTTRLNESNLQHSISNESKQFYVF